MPCLNTQPQIDPNSCLLIDSTADQGFLSCVDQMFRGVARHSDAATAVGHIKACTENAAGKIQVNLFGHGTQGRIATGAGADFCDQGTTCISIRQLNPPPPRPPVNTWQRPLEELKGRINSLTLWSCDAGAGPLGAKLLQFLADTLDAQVAAPAALICCNPSGLFLPEPEGCWQIATPNPATPIVPIGPPVHHFVDSGKVKLFIDGRFKIFDRDHIEAALFYPSESADKPIDLLEQPLAFSSVDLESASVRDCKLPATRTGVIQLSIRGRSALKSLLVFNDRVLNDKENSQIYYDSDLPFRQRLQETHLDFV